MDVGSWTEFTSNNIPGGNLGLLFLLAVTYYSVKYLHNSYQLSKTKKKILARQAQAESGKVRLEKHLERCGNIDMSITKLPFAELQERLQRGDLTATDVLRAYQKKALEVTRETNCVTDFLESAEARAAALDKLDPSKRGPLHGIPLSLKEAVGVKGCDCTVGMSCLIDDLKTENGVLLEVLIQQGAVPFARTNLPQGQMSASCSNPIFGETSNPFDHSRTSGGSTGGEGALIGGGGSPMGIGCDMGGSIRIPCHFCGICGFKPTANRISGAGNITFGQGIVTMAEVYGPLGRDVKSVVELFKASLSPQMFELDPLLPEIAWREEMYSSGKPMKIGFYLYDGGLEAAPAVKRCVLQAKRILEARGHTVVDHAPLDLLYATEHLFLAALNSDDSESAMSYLKHDVVEPSLKVLFFMSSIPHCVKVLLSRILYFLHPVEKATLRAKGANTTYKWWLLNEEFEEYRRRFLSDWKSKELDAVICPVVPFTAFPKGDEVSCFAGLTYTSIYNVVGLPTGVIPAGRVEKGDLVKLRTEYPRRNQAENYVYRVCENSEGLPVGVQCVSLPFHEEVTLRVMRELEEGFRGSVDRPT